VKLAHYVGESPEQRKPLIEKLVKEQAPPSTLNALMNLSAFPPHVAEVLAKGASEQGMSVGQINGHVRNWRAEGTFSASSMNI